MFAFQAVGAHLLSKGGEVRDKRAKHALVEARQPTLFAFKAVGAHLVI
jgi:hypothetical protein